MDKKHWAITLGDPAGVGPEVVEKALDTWLPAHPDIRVTLCGPQGIADAMAARWPRQAAAMTVPSFTGPQGQPSAASGAAALAALMAGIGLAQAGRVNGLVTAPLSKKALSLAGSADLGHTEILARELGAGPVAMAFFASKLRVVLATVHIPLRQVFTALSAKRVVEVAQLFAASLAQHSHGTPRLALAGLNPHAGEDGLLGSEEGTLLAPAVAAARAAGVDLSDPISPDTVFARAVAGEFDGVVALYHDQGLIPIKLLAFGAAVNVTLGLQVVRTSPDHGTAYDRVGTGTARADGMLAALDTALLLLRKA